MAKKKMRQFKLECQRVVTVAWLEDDPRLQVGQLVTLKDSDDPDRLWKILSRSEPQERAEIKRGWKAGGLSETERIV